MLDHFQALLEAVVADPRARSASCRCWRRRSASARPGRWNRQPSPRPARRCVHELVAEQARRTPDAVAVSAAGVELTYAELDARANQLAAHLRELGVGPDVVVAICAERSLETVVAVLAVLKAGGAYAPIDPDYPPERIAFMLADSRSPGAADPAATCWSVSRPTPALTVCLDADYEAIAAHDALAPVTGVGARSSGLRDLHLGLDGPAQGRGDEPPPAAPTCWPGSSGTGPSRGRPARSSSPRSASTSPSRSCSPPGARAARWC